MENADSFIKKYFLILNRPLVTAEDKPIEEIKDCSLDLITLSGDLTYDVIRKEISNWVHKLRDGGVMCGTNYNSPDISYAINQFTKDCGVELHIQGRIVQDWWFIKPFGINHLPVYMPPPIATAGGKKLRILALTWPTFDCDKKMMINARGDLVCPAIDGLTNELIKLGAKVVTKAEDIIETLNLDQAIAYIDNKKIIPETPEEKILIEHLSHEPIHVDELARLTKFDIAAINSTLTIMEMKGMVKNIGSMQYILAR